MLTDAIMEECMHYVQSNLHISYSDLIIDPCADNKHLINLIRNKMCASLFYNADISLTSDPNIQPYEFLTVDYDRFDKTVLSGLWYDDVHIIGCPPEAAAAAFIKKCCEFADSISFILPQGMEKHFTKEYKLLFSTPLTTKNAKVFQIYMRMDKGAAAPFNP